MYTAVNEGTAAVESAALTPRRCKRSNAIISHANLAGITLVPSQLGRGCTPPTTFSSPLTSDDETDDDRQGSKEERRSLKLEAASLAK